MIKTYMHRYLHSKSVSTRSKCGETYVSWMKDDMNFFVRMSVNMNQLVSRVQAKRAGIWKLKGPDYQF